MLFKRDDYKKIKSYEDACAVLKECPIVNDLKEPKHIIALMKLETISRALWGNNFEPDFKDEDANIEYYKPFFEKLDVEDTFRAIDNSVNVVTTEDGTGFSCAGSISTNCMSTNKLLVQQSEEKSDYLGKQFIDLWYEYLKNPE